MKQGTGRKYGGWIASAAAALAVCIAVVRYEQSYADWALVRMVCDGCFTAGVMLVGLGGLIWVANAGGFNALGYGWYLLVRMLSSSRTKFAERLSYLEYVQQRGEKTKTPLCVFATGMVCMAAACVCLYFC